MTNTAAVPSTWDTKTQTFHGGQEYRFIQNFVEDFSVTTNYLGTPKGALDAARDAISTCHHYPPANQEPAKSSLAEFLWPTDYLQHRDRLLLGNGASELIDLVIRMASNTIQSDNVLTWKSGPWDTQYKEYYRSAETANMKILNGDSTERAKVLCIVNPCNPTGDYMPLDQIKTWIQDNVYDGGFVIVDESMQPWHSANFREDSLTSQATFAQELYDSRNVSLYVLHSWTKIWSCTGLRLGSIICPTAAHCAGLRKVQVPWSVNTPAMAFMDAVVRDHEYMQQTWEGTSRLRLYLIQKLSALPASQREQFEYKGKDFLSWVWVDMKKEEVASEAVRLARDAGVPVRSGQPGYQRHTHVRVAVREEHYVDVLVEAWKSL
ncbi:hypothetical protein Unana1_02788 [Umbelopsis nana]